MTPSTCLELEDKIILTFKILGLNEAAGSSLDQYFAKEIESLSLTDKSAEPVSKKHRQRRSIKKKETVDIDPEKSSDEPPAESI